MRFFLILIFVVVIFYYLSRFLGNVIAFFSGNNRTMNNNSGKSDFRRENKRERINPDDIVEADFEEIEQTKTEEKQN